MAAGGSRRFGSGSPKQLKRLNGIPVFIKSLSVFLNLPSVKEIILVVRPNQEKAIKKCLRPPTRYQKVKIIHGGRFRGESVKKGVVAISSQWSVLLVHDTARPLLTTSVVRRVEKAAKKHGVALAGWPLPDTLKKISISGHVRETIPRKNLWLAQTPQGFRMALAKKILTKPLRSATDDVQLAERRGYPIKVVYGAPQNFKVTFPFDFEVCQAMTRRKK